MGEGYIRGSVVDKEKDMKGMNYELQNMVLQTNSKIEKNYSLPRSF